MYSKVTLVGRLTADPELRKVGDDIALTDFTVAVNSVSSKDDEVSFFDVTAWRKLAELVVAYNKKGDPVLVEGTLKQVKWEKDGQKRSKVVVTANNVVFLPGRKNDEASPPSVAPDSEIPF